MIDVLKQLETYLKEVLDFQNVKVLEFEASIDKQDVGQVVIRDLTDDRNPDNNKKFMVVGFATKERIGAKELCQTIEFALDNLKGGKLIDEDDFTPFNSITIRQPTTYLPSQQAKQENTKVYQTQFNFVYLENRYR
jgi:hypothetical protein